MGVFGSTARSGARAHFYSCTVRLTRGRAVCANTVRLPVDVAEGGVLEALDAQLFDPAVVQRAIAGIRTAVVQPRATDRSHAVRRELARVEAQIERIATAYQVSGGEVRTLVDRLRLLEQRRTELWTERDRLHVAGSGTTPRARDLADLEADILVCLADRREMCRQQPAEARRLLDSVLTQRIVLTPHDEGQRGYYTFTATCALDRRARGRAERVAAPAPKAVRSGSGLGMRHLVTAITRCALPRT